MDTKRFWMLLVVVSMALVLNGCGPTVSQSTPTVEAKVKVGDPYKIGAVLDFTGTASSLGAPERDTVQMLQDQLKAAGGVVGPDGLLHPVQIIIYDDESDETKAVLSAKKLIDEDQVSVIVGATQSGTTLAILDTVQQAGVPLISCAASVQIVEPVADRKWVFKTPQSDRLVVAALADYLKKHGITHVAWMSVNNAFGDSGKAQFEAAAPQAGIAIADSEKFGATDTDMTAQLTKIKGSNAQALVIWAIPPAASAATKNAYDLGLKLPIFESHGIGNQTFIDLATKEAAEGVIFPIGKLLVADQLPASDPQKATLLDFVAKYKAAYNTAAGSFGGYAWDAIELAVQALQKAGPDRSKIRDEIEKTQGFTGVSGVFSFSPSDHNGLGAASVVMIRITGGKWTLVQP